MKYVANGHVRETGAKLTQRIAAPSVSKARQIGVEWARENALVLDGIETEQEHAVRTGGRNPDLKRYEVRVKLTRWTMLGITAPDAQRAKEIAESMERGRTGGYETVEAEAAREVQQFSDAVT